MRHICVALKYVICYTLNLKCISIKWQNITHIGFTTRVSREDKARPVGWKASLNGDVSVSLLTVIISLPRREPIRSQM